MNTYAEEGTYPIKVTVFDVGGSTTTIESTAVVQDSPLFSTPTTITSTAGATITPTVASFADANPAGRSAIIS